eukprot:bmy_21394T0
MFELVRKVKYNIPVPLEQNYIGCELNCREVLSLNQVSYCLYSESAYERNKNQSRKMYGHLENKKKTGVIFSPRSTMKRKRSKAIFLRLTISSSLDKIPSESVETADQRIVNELKALSLTND